MNSEQVELPENLDFYRMFCKDSETVNTDGVVFHFIEIVFQLENGFLFFDGDSFRLETTLENDDFEDITHRLQPASRYTIKQVGPGTPEKEIALTNGQHIRTGFTPYGYEREYYQTVLVLPAS